ncbi:hypothetical protein M404DRAFT_1007914 [Pisolithus tinctorius Marx 270]|uniref:Uncharacterized protein n=1 Tax=Pisolithus tinctorius Marx 270 TaxID=870435 RepID=A0A0C3N1F3_PISTI|nr:hypothetical protein M404DRAFT_1007914 [Pisolithus tinctorius Marx 270]
MDPSNSSVKLEVRPQSQDNSGLRIFGTLIRFWPVSRVSLAFSIHRPAAPHRVVFQYSSCGGSTSLRINVCLFELASHIKGVESTSKSNGK